MSATAPIQQFLTAPGPPELGPGPRPGVRSQLELNTALEGLFRALKLQPPNQQLVRALVLLWHDHLDASHMISQGIENADGSFIHAIVHRREPDYSNAKYWWRRVGAHRCFPDIARRVAEWLKAKGEHDLAATLLPRGGWDAFAFVEACAAAADGPASAARVSVLREIQRIESEVLLEYFLNDKAR